MNPRLRTPWLAPVSVKPEHFVNRTADVERALELLGDFVAYDRRQALVLISGDRGIGKSIFGRHVLARLAALHTTKVIPVVVDHRAIGERVFLKRFAKELVVQSRTVLAALDVAASYEAQWLAPLNEIAHSGDRIVRSLTSTSGRETGGGGEFGVGLWGMLAKGSYQWREKREDAQRVEVSLDVTLDVLRTAIQVSLEHLAKHFSVVVFFDDLDQAESMQNPESAKATIQSVLDLAPCIALVHLRAEVAFPDVRRELDDRFVLPELDAAELEQILKRRVQDALNEDRALVDAPGGWEPFRKLMAVTGNPLVLLRWLVALPPLYRQWPPPADWMSVQGLRRLAAAACGGPPIADAELALLGEIVDRLGRATGIEERELISGHSILDHEPVSAQLGEAAVERLKRHELLIPVDRFDPRPGLRLDPGLELARPSVALRLQSA